MERIMTYEILKSFTYVNDAVCQKPIRGIVIQFFGLGSQTRHATDTVEGEYYGEKGILYVYPYNNPWCWMNKQAVDFTDEIIDVLIEKYNLPEDIPIVSTGGSMGGQGALVYMAYAKRKPVACVTNCPVCDVVFHYTERDDLPRTLYSAVYGIEGTLEDGLKSISPLHLVDKMPKSKYHIFHCMEDKAVNIHSHSEKFIDAMRAAGHSVTYDTVPDRGHCALTLQMKKLYAEYIVKAIEENYHD